MRSKSRTKHLESELVQRLDRFVDFGLAAVLFVAPLAMAGRFAPGRLLLVAIVGATAIAWGAARYFSSRPQSWQVTGVEWLAAAAVFLVLLQSMPLPPVVVQNLSPAVSNLLPLHHGMQYADDGVPNESDQSTSQRIMGWTYLSVAPHATRGGLAMALTYVLLFGLVAQRLRRRTDMEQLLKAIALAGVAMSLLGLLQRYLGNGKFLWFLEHPSRDTLTAVKGTFANENHFVHFLALSFGPLLWWLIREQEKAPSDRQKHDISIDSLRERIRNIPRNQLLPIGGLCIVTLAALLSFSRGGLVMMTIAGAVTLGLFAWQRVVGMRTLVTFGLITIVALAGVWINGQEILVRELESLQTTSIESLDENQGRRKIWSAVLSAVPDFALLGSGVGSHRYIYPTYFKDKASVQYTHAESGYLQVLLETGGVGFAMLLFGTGLSGYWIFRVLRHGGKKHTTLAVPLAASWTVSVVHAVFDFNWFIPANMTITLCILAIANRLSQKVETNPAAKRPIEVDQRVHWAVLTAGFSVIMILSTVHFWGPARGHGAYAEYKAWSLATNRFVAKSTGPGRQRSLGFVDPSQPVTGDRMIALLDKDGPTRSSAWTGTRSHGGYLPASIQPAPERFRIRNGIGRNS